MAHLIFDQIYHLYSLVCFVCHSDYTYYFDHHRIEGRKLRTVHKANYIGWFESELHFTQFSDHRIAVCPGVPFAH